MKTPNYRRRLIQLQVQGFTLIELLTVMTIIGILAGLVLGTFKFVQEKAARSRAEAEIKAMEAGLESYKADNGAYPDNSTTQGLVPQNSGSPSSGYNTRIIILYRALTGDTNLDRRVNSTDGNTDIFGATATGGVAPKSYFELKPNQLLPAGGTGTPVTGIVDPWGNFYGYSTAGTLGDSTKGFNPTFDLWSTGGKVGVTADDFAKWLKNW